MIPSPFIGKTGIIHQVLKIKIPRLKTLKSDPIERRWLFTGPPGVAKSELARLLAGEIAGHELNVDFRMGSMVSVEVVRDWVRNAPYRPLIGDMTVRFIDELDTTPSAAVTELRGYLDTLPASVVFIGTTNKQVKELAEPLQSRFQVWKFSPIPSSDITSFLVSRFPDLPQVTLADIAQKSAGNIRAALEDATSQMDVLNFQRFQRMTENKVVPIAA